jgi:hypothetical protein
MLQYYNTGAYLRCLLIDRPRKTASRKRTIILWYCGAKDFAAFVSDLTIPAAENAFPVYIQSIIYGAEGTGREDYIANKYACAVTMVAVHAAAAAVVAPGFGNNFENRWKRWRPLGNDDGDGRIEEFKFSKT